MTDKISARQSAQKSTSNNPLADIADKFGSKFWQETQKEIQRSRKTDREEINKLLDEMSDE